MIPKTIAFRYDDEAKALVIDYPDIPLIGPYRIKDDTLASMSFAQAAAFIGEKVLLMHPIYVEIFKDYLWSDNGTVPPMKE
jgi:hypothetical protein